jgi:hypothetical protein
MIFSSLRETWSHLSRIFSWTIWSRAVNRGGSVRFQRARCAAWHRFERSPFGFYKINSSFRLSPLLGTSPPHLLGGADQSTTDTEATEERGFPLAGGRRPGKRLATFDGAQLMSKTGRQCVVLHRTSTRSAEIFCPTGNLPIGQKKNSLCVLCAWFVWISEYVPLDRG